MKPRRPAILSALVATLAALDPRAAPAAERGCPALALEPDPAFRGRWPGLVERIADEFGARTDIDTCARVELRLRDDAVVDLYVSLPDGRTASRSVTRSEDVIPTLQALLLLPDPLPGAAHTREAPASSQSSSTATPSPSPVAPKRRTPRAAWPASTDSDQPPPVARPARELGFELSVVTGARVGDGQVAAGAGVLSFLEVKSWLVGFQGRADSYRPSTGGDAETALELALLAGRRLNLGSVALDLTAGPGVAMKGFALSQSDTAAVNGPPAEPPPPPPPHSEPSSGAVPRLILGARLGFSPRSVFRTFVGIDGEVGPAGSSDVTELPSARLPTYTVGLALGATIGTP